MLPQPSAPPSPRGASHDADGATSNVGPAPTAASSNGAVPTAAAASIGVARAHAALIVSDDSTTTDYIIVRQSPPFCHRQYCRNRHCQQLSTDAPPFDAGSNPCARIVTAVSDQASAVAATKAVTNDDRSGAGGEEFRTRLAPPTTTVAATAGTADYGRESES